MDIVVRSTGCCCANSDTPAGLPPERVSWAAAPVNHPRPHHSRSDLSPVMLPACYSTADLPETDLLAMGLLAPSVLAPVAMHCPRLAAPASRSDLRARTRTPRFLSSRHCRRPPREAHRLLLCRRGSTICRPVPRQPAPRPASSTGGYRRRT